MKLEIEKSLMVSTAHVLQKDMELLEQENSYPYTVHHNEYGAMIYIVKDMVIPVTQSVEFIKEGDFDKQLSDFSKDFRTLLKLAQENDCTWLHLDCDGTVYPELPEHDW